MTCGEFDTSDYATYDDMIREEYKMCVVVCSSTVSCSLFRVHLLQSLG